MDLIDIHKLQNRVTVTGRWSAGLPYGLSLVVVWGYRKHSGIMIWEVWYD